MAKYHHNLLYGAEYHRILPRLSSTHVRRVSDPKFLNPVLRYLALHEYLGRKTDAEVATNGFLLMNLAHSALTLVTTP